MERFEDGTVVVQLCEGRVQSDEESVVDAWVAYVVAYCGDEECEGVERTEKFRDGGFRR